MKPTLSVHLPTLIVAWMMAWIPACANAGFIEIGASGSFRRSNLDANSFDESMSLTGSLSYYFNDASALETSYTDGQSRRVVGGNEANGHTTQMNYKTLGLDFVYTFGSRESGIRPYVKAGVNYIMAKRIVDQYRLSDGSLYPANTLEDDPGLVPSAGFGFKLGLTENLSLKVGVDGWSSRPLNKEPQTYDYFGRVGLSWLF